MAAILPCQYFFISQNPYPGISQVKIKSSTIMMLLFYAAFL